MRNVPIKIEFFHSTQYGIAESGSHRCGCRWFVFEFFERRIDQGLHHLFAFFFVEFSHRLQTISGQESHQVVALLEENRILFRINRSHGLLRPVPTHIDLWKVFHYCYQAVSVIIGRDPQEKGGELLMLGAENHKVPEKSKWSDFHGASTISWSKTTTYDF